MEQSSRRKYYEVLLLLMLSLVLDALSISTVRAVPLTVPALSTFDTDLDGWVLDSVSIGVISFVQQEGNPGGFLQIADTGPVGNGALAPSTFLGNWSSLDGVGELSLGPQSHSFLATSSEESGH